MGIQIRLHKILRIRIRNPADIDVYIFVCRDLVEREENFNCDVSDAFLIRFLRAKKYDYEAAFKMLQRYLGIRARREGGSLKINHFSI
jgi:hypothetical protein